MAKGRAVRVLTLVLGLVLVQANDSPVAGQKGGDGWTECLTTVTGTTTVRGRLLSIEAPDSDPGGRAFLFGESLSGPPWGCRVKADSRGHFEFRGLPAGDN